MAERQRRQRGALPRRAAAGETRGHHRAAELLLLRAEAEAAEREARRAKLLQLVPEVVEQLRARFGVRRAWLFGSLAWGGWHAGSDVDLALDGLAADDLGEASAQAAAQLGHPVEVFRIESLPTSFVERIRREGTEIR
ncbi:MAG: nucleotidyltransferase domain-containing protein [Deltaproteobacteria bacterium]|nr:nucleotidyltransferase domain-containing protein [Deltaproteobacteria bacterium]